MDPPLPIQKWGNSTLRSERNPTLIWTWDSIHIVQEPEDPNSAWPNTISSHGHSLVSDPPSSAHHGQVWPPPARAAHGMAGAAFLGAWCRWLLEWIHQNPSSSVSHTPAQLGLYRSAHCLWEGTNAMAGSAPAPLLDFRVPQGRTLQKKLPIVFWGREATLQYLLVYFSTNSG